ncbi:hypothetical protein HHI36_019761 [Cryptolaemus montrouzieri]|uniref:Uncharacterized protein n=1 Tax=Cryptolaemus montrouzieri TaxID=559131 RepID=A0ABD2N8T2_9CUCU
MVTQRLCQLTAGEINGFAKEFKIPDPKLEELFERIKHYFDAKLDSQMEMIRVENDKLFAKFENRVKTLEAEVDSLKEQIHSLEEKGSDKLLEEIHERPLRSSNIMIYEVAESYITNIGEKVSEDKERVAVVLQATCYDDTVLQKVVKVGYAGTKPRPNVGGKRTRLSEFKEFCDYDVIILTETYLNDDFYDPELGLIDYNIFRKDRDYHTGTVSREGEY